LPITPPFRPATAALSSAGFRSGRDAHHYRVIQSLEFMIAPGQEVIDTFDSFRKKRNASSYDVAGMVSDREAREMLELAKQLRIDVENWIRKGYPRLRPKV
jgi:hypothetical protein